jgi:hypothetical protein
MAAMSSKHWIGAGLMALSFGVAADDAPWPVAGQQGVVRIVIVPTALVADADAYRREIAQLCRPDTTCFLNFYGNSTGAPLAVPLPAAIEQEPTAVFRRSMKQGAELFRWSCRLQPGTEACF